MLVRISCRRCRLASLWTDDAECFLATVCPSRRRCEATLVKESFAQAAPKRATGDDPIHRIAESEAG